MVTALQSASYDLPYQEFEMLDFSLSAKSETMAAIQSILAKFLSTDFKV